jgi:hypothetical protein
MQEVGIGPLGVILGHNFRDTRIRIALKTLANGNYGAPRSSDFAVAVHNS